MNTSYQLGLVLVPAELSELAQVESMTLLEPGMQMNEDDDCQPFPDPLFDMTVSGKCNLKLETGMEMNEDDDCQPFPDQLFDMTISGKCNLKLETGMQGSA